ncbi:MAG: DNA-processing protein DprA, partial [Candidatus Omnitrophota bacterium]|nr:DNA-processing protein DprA [Candidatus Omnitrophota bacterium]
WDNFGSGQKIISATISQLRQVEGITDSLAKKITECKSSNIDRELDLIKKHQVKIISFKDKDYPQNLKTIYDPPMVLYLKGSLLSGDNQAVAIVGSRRASFYGISCAEKFGRELAELGITVVSGMARGIDTASHRSALKARGRTIAVLGNGLSNVYPPENKDLFNEIADNGAVISEFSMQVEPLAYNFPRRNRIISGLSLGVVVVEAARNSGALITAHAALEQGREVFAVPGKVDSANSKGVNELIKQGAKLTGDIRDILEEINIKLKENFVIKDKSSVKAVEVDRKKLSAEETLLLRLIDKSPRYIDEIISESRLEINKVMSGLMHLEMLHIVKQLPGKLFAKADA